MKKVYFLITDAGGGHRAPAMALKSYLEQKGCRWNIIIVNIYREILYKCDITYRLFKFNGEDIYNYFILKKRMNWLAKPFAHYVRQHFKRSNKSSLFYMKQFWQNESPNMVVSFIPFANHVVGESLHEILPHVPFVVLLTDLDEWIAKLWFSSSYAHYLCPSNKAMQQATKLNIACTNRISGVVINSKFYDRFDIDKTEVRKKLGLQSQSFTGLVMFGGRGSKDMKILLRALAKTTLTIQLILICGDNEKLTRELRAIRTSFPTCILGVVDDVSYYMQCADFFIGKSGAGSINEALQMGLPVITQLSASTLPQEISVAKWVQENRYGICISSYRTIGDAVVELQKNLVQYQDNVARYQNRGLFEVADILKMLLPN